MSSGTASMFDVGDERIPGVKRVRLTGARFDGGRLPVDSLVELQRYQDVVRIAAVAEWRREHPGEEPPSDLRNSISLTIERIDEGSADIFLAFEQHAEYVQYQAGAQEAADAIIGAAYSAAPIPELPALSLAEDLEFREAVSQIGFTLRSEQSIEFYLDPSDAQPVTITVETRRNAVEQLSRIEDFLVPPDSSTTTEGLQSAEESLVGRVTILNADDQRFTLVLADRTKVHGWYRQNPELLEDFRAVVNSTEEGPLTRISGTLQTKDGKPFRFKDVDSIQRIQFDDTAWGARLTEFASLPSGWEDGEGDQISSVALEAAQMLLRVVDRALIERPGVFPNPEGGVLIEWASPERVRSVEITADGTFEMFSLQRAQRSSQNSETADLTKAIAFIEAEKA
ncbi:hypothetical protein [Cryobacterium sp. M91]|uniref:hypothetical protein n=1 Tax=Cryobacterium sp. M91 TaxID=2048294 RepID=UPI0011AFE30B|nr:hypothetical protein [Cryobacterium sp. M91]